MKTRSNTLVAMAALALLAGTLIGFEAAADCVGAPAQMPIVIRDCSTGANMPNANFTATLYRNYPIPCQTISDKTDLYGVASISFSGVQAGDLIRIVIAPDGGNTDGRHWFTVNGISGNGREEGILDSSIDNGRYTSCSEVPGCEDEMYNETWVLQYCPNQIGGSD